MRATLMCDMINDALNKFKKLIDKEEERRLSRKKKMKTNEADSSIILRTGRWSSWTNYRNEKRNRAEIEESSIRSTTDLLLSRLSFLVFPPLL